MTDLFWIEASWPGRLAIAPRPRGGDWLEDELKGWKSAGVDFVVSALTGPEIRELELSAEEEICHQLGTRYESLAIEDRSVPDRGSAVAKLQHWHNELALGHTLVIHCRQGIGRSSMLASSILILNGLQPQDAWNRVELARGRPVPDTEEQRQWADQLQKYATRPVENTIG